MQLKPCGYSYFTLLKVETKEQETSRFIRLTDCKGREEDERRGKRRNRIQQKEITRGMRKVGGRENTKQSKVLFTIREVHLNELQHVLLI